MHWNAKRAAERLDSPIQVGLSRSMRDRLEQECNRRRIPVSQFVREAIADKLDSENE